MSDYHLSVSQTSVRLWLANRLPLQPRGAFLEARKGLRAALQNFQPNSESILSASYFSLDNTFCDVENVLLYNVGTGAFSRLTGQGLAISRIRETPPLSPVGQAFPHYHEYKIISIPQHFSTTNSPSFTFPLSSISSATKLHDVWWQATEAPTSRQASISGRFSLNVELGITHPIRNVAAILKPLLDGIVAAMHADPNPESIAIRRLSARCGWEISKISDKLLAPPNPILGKRKVISTYREFVKWDPADHLCEVCMLIVRPAQSLSCSVTITPVT